MSGNSVMSKEAFKSGVVAAMASVGDGDQIPVSFESSASLPPVGLTEGPEFSEINGAPMNAAARAIVAARDSAPEPEFDESTGAPMNAAAREPKSNDIARGFNLSDVWKFLTTVESGHGEFAVKLFFAAAYVTLVVSTVVFCSASVASVAASGAILAVPLVVAIASLFDKCMSECNSCAPLESGRVIAQDTSIPGESATVQNVFKGAHPVGSALSSAADAVIFPPDGPTEGEIETKEEHALENMMANQRRDRKWQTPQAEKKRMQSPEGLFPVPNTNPKALRVVFALGDSQDRLGKLEDKIKASQGLTPSETAEYASLPGIIEEQQQAAKNYGKVTVE